MIDARQDKQDIWTKLAAPLAPQNIQWRQDGRATQRDGKWYARFVAYIDAQFVRERLDSVVPGEWDLTITELPRQTTEDGEEDAYAFKARLTVLGVHREDVGSGKDYKSASSDAFKRAAVRFGVGHELYSFEQNWVQVDSDSRFAKPVEDPAAAYARRTGQRTGRVAESRSTAVDTRAADKAYGNERTETVVLEMPAENPNAGVGPLAGDEVPCPKCGGRTWDNRATKRNPKAPDYKCRDRACDGVVWPPKEEKQAAKRTGMDAEHMPSRGPEPLVPETEDSLPF